MSQNNLIAGPLYILLASLGHPDAHEYVRKKIFESLKTNKPLYKAIIEDEDLKPYLEKLTGAQMEIILNPSKYTGIASKKTEKITDSWEILLREEGLW